MDIEGLFLLGIPLTVLTLSIYVTYIYAKAHNRGVLAALGALWFVFTGFMFVAMENASGWDGLTYLLALMGLSAPGGIGALIGGIIGWVKKDNEKYA